MAYLREEKENLEISFPLSVIWEAVPKVIAELDWTIQEVNDSTHHLKVKTRGAFISYPSELLIDLAEVDEKTTRMTLIAKTPVTTITSVADFGRTRDRLEKFVEALAKEMKLPNEPTKETE
jgi:hypothetical protein